MILQIALFSALVALDLQNTASRWARYLTPGAAVDVDFTFVVPLFGSPSYFKNGDYLSRYKQNTLLAVNLDNEVMERFADELESDGWRVHRARISGRVSCPTLIRSALDDVTTAYVIRIDGDTRSPDHPGKAVLAARRWKADLCSVRVRVANRETLVGRMQAVEYEMSMIGRRNRPWMTSGAAMVARTVALRAILDAHSGWFPGEDLETGVIANHYRLRVIHVDFVFETDAPDTFIGWFRQRRMWWSGSFRMAFVNADQTIRYPITFLYTVLAVWILLVGKWHELLSIQTVVRIIPFLILVYTAISVAANWEVRSRWMVLIPYYALFQALVIPIFGAAYYILLWWRAGTLTPPGRYRIGFRREALDLPVAP